MRLFDATRAVVTRLVVIAVALAMWGCGAPSATPRAGAVSVFRPPVTWQGSGSRTLEFVSESGKFRLSWETRPETQPGSGAFRLTVHSAVSGRPLREIVDQKGEGKGSTLFEDDPRPFNLMVESTGVAWFVSAEELVAVVAPQETTKNTK